MLWSSTKQSVCNNVFKGAMKPNLWNYWLGIKFFVLSNNQIKNVIFGIDALVVFHRKKIVLRLNSWQTNNANNFLYATDPMCLVGGESCINRFLVSFFLLVLKQWTRGWFWLKAWNYETPIFPLCSALTSWSPPKTLSRRWHLKLQLKEKTVNDDSFTGSKKLICISKTLAIRLCLGLFSGKQKHWNSFTSFSILYHHHIYHIFFKYTKVFHMCKPCFNSCHWNSLNNWMLKTPAYYYHLKTNNGFASKLVKKQVPLVEKVYVPWFALCMYMHILQQ